VSRDERAVVAAPKTGRGVEMAAKARAQGEGGAAVTGTDALVQAAETLIVRGKEQGYLTPDDILQAFPEIEAEPDHLERIFSVFREMGIEVTDPNHPVLFTVIVPS